MEKKKIRESGSLRTNPFPTNSINATRLSSLSLPPKHTSLPFHSIPFHFFLSIFPRFGHARKNKRRKEKNHKGTRENKSRSLAPSSPPLSLKAASSCHHPLDPPPFPLPPKSWTDRSFHERFNFRPPREPVEKAPVPR